MSEVQVRGAGAPARGCSALSFDSIFEPITGELAEFERRLDEAVCEDLGPMAESMKHIVRAGGKRLRPALVILAAHLGSARARQVLDLAVGIEFIHTATLVHDDLIDQSATRRGIPTIHTAMGSNPAIIIGDYYFAKGAYLLSSIGDPSIDSMISQTVMNICMGELLQMTSQRDYDQSIDDYLLKIDRKTAGLLSACCFCGATLGGLDDGEREAMRRYGHNLGMAFQIADDVLDYTATTAEIGKPVGADLRQGTVTLPLMYALRDPQVGSSLRAVLDNGASDDDRYALVVGMVRSSRGVELAARRAQEFAEQARHELASFTLSPVRDTLETLCDYVVARRI